MGVDPTSTVFPFVSYGDPGSPKLFLALDPKTTLLIVIQSVDIFVLGFKRGCVDKGSAGSKP